MNFAKLVELIGNSARLAFALLTAGIAIFFGQIFKVWPPDWLAFPLLFVIWGALIGAGIMLSYIFEFAFGTLLIIIAILVRLARKWRENMNVMDNLPRLSPEGEAALLWMAYHREQTIEGAPLEPPFRELRSFGFIRTTQDSLDIQKFRVHPQVYLRRKYLGARFFHGQYMSIINGPSPWRIWQQTKWTI